MGAGNTIAPDGRGSAQEARPSPRSRTATINSAGARPNKRAGGGLPREDRLHGLEDRDDQGEQDHQPEHERTQDGLRNAAGNADNEAPSPHRPAASVVHSPHPSEEVETSGQHCPRPPSASAPRSSVDGSCGLARCSTGFRSISASVQPGSELDGVWLRRRWHIGCGLHLVVAIRSDSPQRQPGRRLNRKPTIVPEGLPIRRLPPSGESYRTNRVRQQIHPAPCAPSRDLRTRASLRTCAATPAPIHSSPKIGDRPIQYSHGRWEVPGPEIQLTTPLYRA